jgi:hypothetical protein
MPGCYGGRQGGVNSAGRPCCCQIKVSLLRCEGTRVLGRQPLAFGAHVPGGPRQRGGGLGAEAQHRGEVLRAEDEVGVGETHVEEDHVDGVAPQVPNGMGMRECNGNAKSAPGARRMTGTDRIAIVTGRATALASRWAHRIAEFGPMDYRRNRPGRNAGTKSKGASLSSTTGMASSRSPAVQRVTNPRRDPVQPDLRVHSGPLCRP